jgi:hypothetical protein
MLNSDQIDHQQIPAIISFIFQEPLREELNYRIPKVDVISARNKYV